MSTAYHGDECCTLPGKCQGISECLESGHPVLIHGSETGVGVCTVCDVLMFAETLCTVDGRVTSSIQAVALSTHRHIFVVKGKSAKTQGLFVHIFFRSYVCKTIYNALFAASADKD